MRKSNITSSITTVVAVANDCLVVAGVAARGFLRHMDMRGHLGNWQRPNAGGQRERRYEPSRTSTRLSSTRDWTLFADALDSTTSVVTKLWQIAFSKRPTQQALAFCPAYAAIARSRSARRG